MRAADSLAASNPRFAHTRAVMQDATRARGSLRRPRSRVHWWQRWRAKLWALKSPSSSSIVTRQETLKTSEKTWEDLDEKESYVKTGDPVVQIIGS